MPLSKKVGIFLDADGVLWPDYGPGEILNGLAEAKIRLNEFTKVLKHRDQYTIHIVTNQTLSARGQMSHFKFKSKVNETFKDLVIQNLVDSFEVCYHHPQAKNILLRRNNCQCRKPAPGMILKTIKKYNLKPERCVIVGDRITDISAGRAAQVRKAILINNPRALEVNVNSRINMNLDPILEFSLSQNLLEAASIIVEFMNHD